MTLTENSDTELDPRLREGRLARLYLGASLGRVDNVFELTRPFLSPLERPFYTPTSGGWNQVWYGYAPYNPDMVRKYLDILRVVNNFIHTGKTDRATPAMRLGFADRPLTYADMLWPVEKIPVPKRTRRKGRAQALIVSIAPLWSFADRTSIFRSLLGSFRSASVNVSA